MGRHHENPEDLEHRNGSKKRGNTKNQIQKTQDQSLKRCVFSIIDFRVRVRGWERSAETRVNPSSATT